MKKTFTLITGILYFIIAAAQNISGNWEGKLNANGTELPIVFHLMQDSIGKIVGTFDSPAQLAYGLKCSKVVVTGDSVLFEMKAFGATYNGLFSTTKKNISGNWSQGGMSLPLDLKKTSDVATVQELKRPQTPKPPFNYYTEEVSYTNADNSITFGGTFTRPSLWAEKVNGMKYPVVLLITGSGQQDRDETIFEHKPFAVIADHLAKQGIASLRVDDRGKGKTTGTYSTSTTLDFAKDAEAGLEFLKTRKDADANNIGLIGHSEGGMIASMLAAKRKDIKFIVLLAAPGVPTRDLMAQQVTDVLISAGIGKEETASYIPLYNNFISIAINEKDSAEAATKMSIAFEEWKAITPETVVKNTTGVTDEKTKKDFITGFNKEVRSAWFKYYIKFNPASYLSNVRCAVLALNGEKDIQVAATPNLEAIREIMVKKMVRTFKVQPLPGLNHLFQHCNTCTVQEYAQLEETFAPEALQIMSSWIKQVVK